MLGDVLRTRVREDDSRVLTAAGEDQPERTPDGDATTDHAHLGPVEVDSVTTQQLDDASRRAGQGRWLVQHEPPQVDRVEAVCVLVRIDE